jgi:hypothetical protein
MTTIAIVPESLAPTGRTYRAVAGRRQSVGKTPGEALDGLTAQLGEDESGTLVIVQHMRPDAFFSAAQQQRLTALMERQRAARAGGTPLSAAEQAELEGLVAAEVEAATRRAEALLRGLQT